VSFPPSAKAISIVAAAANRFAGLEQGAAPLCEDIIQKHAEISGFPATTITEVCKMIDPTTERLD
jgi:hypothetical protein